MRLKLNAIALAVYWWVGAGAVGIDLSYRIELSAVTEGAWGAYGIADLSPTGAADWAIIWMPSAFGLTDHG